MLQSGTRFSKTYHTPAIADVIAGPYVSGTAGIVGTLTSIDHVESFNDRKIISPRPDGGRHAGRFQTLAQNAGAAVAPGTNGVPPVGTPPNASPGVTTGTGAGSSTGAGVNQPGVPNTSTPGVIGTGASPSGLPGDSPTQPGYPGKVGN